jgi:hypothetical protein
MGFFIYICDMIISARVIKLKNIRNDSSLIEEGEIFEGVLFDWPTLNQSIFLYRKFGHSYQTILHTTKVSEIVDRNTFATRNSLYKVVSIQEERDEKISSILD